MERWHNKIAVVTGASSGIGAACCKYLIQNGMIVIGLARRKERIEELRNQISEDDDGEKRSRLHALHCDVTKEDEVIATFKQIEAVHGGGVAVLINNAGIVRSTELLRSNNSDDLRAIVDTNIMGVAYCTREAFQSMQRHNINDGHVINVNSVAGHKVLHFEGMSTNMYPASKHAVTAMTEVYRNEFLMYKTKVRVTSISPGVVDTEIFTDEARSQMQDFAFLRAEDVADAIIYCLQVPPHVQIHELTIKPVGEKF